MGKTRDFFKKIRDTKGTIHAKTGAIKDRKGKDLTEAEEIKKRWECKLVQPLWRTVWRFLKKLEIELPYDPAIPLVGIHTKETRSERDTCTPMFIAALFIIARTWKQPRCPTADEWIRKCGTYTQWNITQLLKRIHLNQF